MLVIWTGLAVLALGGGFFLANRVWSLRGQRGTVLASPGRAEPFKGSALTVGTYNIHRARGTDDRRDLRRIARIISGCDIVALQEVEGPRLGSSHNQAWHLGRWLRLAAHFAPSRKLFFFPHRGNALLCRFPVSHWQRLALFPSTGRAHRNLTVYQVDLAGSSVHILNTHLSKPAEGASPFEAVMSAFGQYPRAILLGDFNAPMDHPAMRRWLPPDTVDALAGAGFDPRRVDMILIRGLSVDEAWSSPIGPSDHPFFAVRLRLK